MQFHWEMKGTRGIFSIFFLIKRVLFSAAHVCWVQQQHAAFHRQTLTFICISLRSALTELSWHRDLVHAGLTLAVVARVVWGQNGALWSRRTASTWSWRKTSKGSIQCECVLRYETSSYVTTFQSFYARFTDLFNRLISCLSFFLSFLLYCILNLN